MKEMPIWDFFPETEYRRLRYGKDCAGFGRFGGIYRLLARSATGQPVTTYTSHYRRPREGGEYHIIIVDNGRSTILSKPDHIKTLNCIRCGACMNTCPVYRLEWGYSYTYFIPGPIGINLGMAHDPEKYYDNLSACSLCISCSDVCPVKVDLAEQIYKWRQDLDGLGKGEHRKENHVRWHEVLNGNVPHCLMRLCGRLR